MILNKKSFTIIICMVLLIVSFFVPSIIQGIIPTACATKLQQINYVGFVTATGEVVQDNKQVVTTQCPVVVSEVLVKVGETVKSGQPVISVNREETAKKILEVSNFTSAVGLTTGVFATSYEEALDKIPANVFTNIDGVIDSINVGKGGYIEKDAVVLSMIGAGDLSVNLQVPESKISNVKVGQAVEITGSGFENSKYYGYVKSISTSARKVFAGTNQETVIDVVVSIENLDEKIKAGYTTKARIITQQKRELSVAPYESVMQDNNGNEYVYVFSKGLAIRKDIETGLELGEGVEVVSGVNDNEIIISSPDKIKESGDLVKITD